MNRPLVRVPASVFVTVAVFVAAIVLAQGYFNTASADQSDAKRLDAPSVAEIDRANAEEKAEDAKRLRWLSSDEAREERLASLTAFAGLDEDGAIDLLLERFADQLEKLATDPDRVLTDSEVVEAIGGRASLVEGDDGEDMLLESPLPTSTAKFNGERRRVDLTLDEEDGGFAPQNARVPLQIPATSDGTLSVGDSVKVNAEGANPESEGTVLEEKDVFYHEAYDDTDLMYSPVFNGVEVFHLLRSQDSPERFSLTVGSGEKTHLEAGPDGQITLEGPAGGERATVSPVSAVDAQGTPVEATMKVVGDHEVAIAVAHQDQDVAYPILVDPVISNVESWNWYSYGGGQDTWTWAQTGDYLHSTSCIVAGNCWGAGGLYMRSKANVNYAANSYGQWVYNAPGGSDAYISRVVFGLNSTANNCTGAAQPHMYAGLYKNSTGTWPWIKNFSPTVGMASGSYDSSTAGTTGTRHAVAGIGAASSAVNIVCGRDFAVSSASIYLADGVSPTLDTVTVGTPIGVNTAVPVTGRDGGLGVAKFVVIGEVEGGGYSAAVTEHPTCTGISSNPCPATWTANLNYPPNLKMGVIDLTIYAQDAKGNTSTLQTVPVIVDRTKPDTIIDSGPGTEKKFAYHSSELFSTFQCQIDAGAWASCPSSGYAIPNTLTNGLHTFKVRAIDWAANVDSSPAQATFRVGPSETTISAGPSGSIPEDDFEFEYYGQDVDLTFECKLDAEPFAACDKNGYEATDVAEGAHQFQVRSVTPMGVVDPTPAVRDFTIDLTPPSLSLDTYPRIPTKDRRPVFEFTAEAGVTVQCSIDNGVPGYGPCSGTGAHQPASDLSDGSRVFRVRATDDASNVTTRTATFEIDNDQPETSFDSGPTGTIGRDRASFAFDSDESEVTFECRIDGGDYEPCTDGYVAADMSDGSHTIEARAIDQAGNIDSTPASRTITVRTTGPDVEILTGPGTYTNDTTPEFTFESDYPQNLECAFGTAEDEAEFAPCSQANPFEVTPALADGTYIFWVRSFDDLDDENSDSREFTVDTVAPTSSITSEAFSVTDERQPTFLFSSNDSKAHFQCHFEAESFRACSGPGKSETPASPLTDGSHVFSLRAVDAAGNVEATPKTQSFDVDTTRPNTTILTGPKQPSANTSPTFTYESSEPGADFECSLDLGAFDPCAGTGAPLSGLSDGKHVFKVRAMDGAGNRDVSPAVRQFVIDTTAPEIGTPTGDLTEDEEPGLGLSVEVVDGEETDSGYSSGVQKIDVYVDNVLRYTDTSNCVYAFETCQQSLLRDLELPYQVAVGEHDYRIEAKDALGNAATPVAWRKNTPAEGTINLVPKGSNPSACATNATKRHYDISGGKLTGTPHSDFIVVPRNVKVVDGGPGCDVIIGTARSEVLMGGGDNDVIRGNRSNDTIYGGSGDDRIFGGIGDDHMYGDYKKANLGGDDILDGGPGADYIWGNGGDDVIRGGQGLDRMTGEGGFDTLSFANATTPGTGSNQISNLNNLTGQAVSGFPKNASSGDPGVVVDLRNGKTDVAWNGPVDTGGAADFLYIPKEEKTGDVKITNTNPNKVETEGDFEKVFGSPFQDLILGGNADERIFGGPGADIIVGGGGVDVLDGGSGSDFIKGNSSSTLRGGTGGAASIDQCVPKSGSTHCDGTGYSLDQRNPNKIEVGFQQPDSLNSRENDLFVNGSKFDDNIRFMFKEGTNDQVIFKAANANQASRFEPGEGCRLAGESVVCNLRKSDMGVVSMWGGEGVDTLVAQSLSEKNNSASISLLGGPDYDTLQGGSMDEMIVDGPTQRGGTETLNGAGGDDVIIQGDGGDGVNGQGGDDLLISAGLCENDSIDGSGGSDNAQFHPFKWGNDPDDWDRIGVFADIRDNQIGLVRGPNQSNHRCNDGHFEPLKNIDDLEGSEQGDYFLGDSGNNMLLGRGGKDRLFGRNGKDNLSAKDKGNDLTLECGGNSGDTVHIDVGEEKIPHGCPNVSYKGRTYGENRAGVASMLVAAEEESKALVDSADVDEIDAEVQAVQPILDYPLDEDNGVVAENALVPAPDATYASDEVGANADGNGPELGKESPILTSPDDQSIELDGQNDYLDLGEVPTITQYEDGGFSIEMWAKFDDPASSVEYLYSQESGDERLELTRNVEGKIVFRSVLEAGEPTVKTFDPVSVGEWHHLVGTLQGDKISLFVDGFEFSLGYGESVFPETEDDVNTYVGSDDGTSGFVDGGIDEVLIYPEALPDEVIAEHVANSEVEEPEYSLVEEVDSTDTDDDGVPDETDNCVATPNPGQEDENLDAMGDACVVPDGDGDGFADDVDNCVEIYNEDQADLDDNGVGDVCDELESVDEWEDE
ncbi:MAG: thrombospondin type 3 repeat-containing protein [Solirubrobacterales bacterium]|nr:thrombospondin type 3 repeat-containing protein [Solirubrobacterales bacterium]